jgi:hypothetical protein
MRYTSEEEQLAKQLWETAKANGTLKRAALGSVTRLSTGEASTVSMECTWRSYLPEARELLRPRH